MNPITRLLLLCLLSPVALAASDPLSSAVEALDDGFPGVALVKIESAFPNLASTKEKPEVVLAYARALVEAGRPQEAEKILSKHAKKTGRAGDFWMAQSLAAQGRWADALPRFRSCADDRSFPLRNEAQLGCARMLANLNRPADAIEFLAPAFHWSAGRLREEALLDLASLELARARPAGATTALDALPADSIANQPRYQLLRGLHLAQEGNDAAAIPVLASISPNSPEVAISTLSALAESLIRSGDAASAESRIEEFVAAHPNAEGLDRAFAILDRLYASGAASSSSELKRWAEDRDPTLRRLLATYYLACFEARQDHVDTAAELLEKCLSAPGANPVLLRASLDLANLRLRQSRPDEALKLLPSGSDSPRAHFLEGLALAALGKNQPAADAFRRAARTTEFAESALFNAALCELLAGTTPNRALAALAAQFPESPKIAAFRLQEAMEFARTRNAAAPKALGAIAASGSSPVATAAALALAEWKYQQLDRAGARLELQKIANRPDSDEPRRAALDVFLTDSGESASDDATIQAARLFLQRYPGSQLEPEVRMKLGEILFRKGDYAAARVELESLARKFPGPPLEMPALFLAGQSAARTLTATAPDDAMILFEEVASGGGPLGLRARFEQSVLQNAQGRQKEAIVLLDRILASQPDPDTRAAALVEKGKTLYSMGSPESLRAAIAVWKSVADEPAAPSAWRNQALARMGTAHEKLGDSNAAIAAYYDVIKVGQSATPEFFWFYKAGFGAARLLEAAKNWSEAIRVYTILASFEGPRAEEARARINKLRLENFLWEPR